MLDNQFSPAEDQSSDEEKLEKYSGDVDWSYLKPHFEAGAMIYVDPALDLKTAGLAFAKDDKASVKEWLKKEIWCNPASCTRRTGSKPGPVSTP